MSAPHLDDDALSGVLDGEPLDPGATRHLNRCPSCEGRLDAMRTVAQLVGTTPPPAPPAARDAAVAAALAASPGTPTARRPGRTGVLWAAAAAALVVMAMAGSVYLGGDGDNGRTATVGQAAAGSVADGGDLGEMSDGRALAEHVRAVVEPSGPVATGGGAAGDNHVTDEAAPEATPMLSTPRPVQGARASEDGPLCEKEVASTYGKGLGALVYRATVRWNGRPAAVLGYRLDQPSGALDHRVYVLALSGCELLVAQTI